MAINKERLEELINEGTTVYSLDKQVKYPIPIFLKDGENVIVNDNELVNSVRVIDKIENLYETQKEAEWHLKYHATRTEELNLPTWKEFKDYNENISVSFVGEDWVVYELSNDIDIYHKPSILLTADGECFEEWKSTEENYIKACDLCLKLFKGEQDAKN